MCRNYIRDHGYLTRVHVLPDMAASTFRQCILKPLLLDGTVQIAAILTSSAGKGQAHKVFRDKTRRYQKLITEEIPKQRFRMSIVNEPRATAQTIRVHKFCHEKSIESRVYEDSRFPPHFEEPRL